MRYAVPIAGGDTSLPINLKKRVELLLRCYDATPHPKFLDCGCGAGEYIRALSGNGWRGSGVEYQDAKIARARSAGLSEDQVVKGDIQSLPYGSESFDVVLFNEVLEHVPDDAKALKEACRVLKQRGQLFVFAPNRLYPFESHGVRIKGSKKMVPVWTPFIPYIPLSVGQLFFDYTSRLYWPWQLRRAIRDAGFRITRVGNVWQTFEGLANESSGTTSWMAPLRPCLRRVSELLEKTPVLNAFGVSQFVQATKTEHT